MRIELLLVVTFLTTCATAQIPATATLLLPPPYTSLETSTIPRLPSTLPPQFPLPEPYTTSSTSSVRIQTLTTPNTTPTTRSGSLSSSTSSIARATYSPSWTSQPDGSGGSSGFSSSAKIGLAAGIPCGIILIAAVGLGAYFFGKHRARAQPLPTYATGTEDFGPVYERTANDGTEVRRHTLDAGKPPGVA
ncbi:uncharacterized protein K460DRAFT_415639 [Cucurbitaria berberidis CBS 394.84]|uniref:Mid2 domain-containing protein n=1 Tax=Cucurbitaria berberidis CBS 394.84 TaxID=1168544 RepID=A0A9P4GQ71_9PLEO|nr:uncharacterized protein K460DRAFT_415639 [Cucurbitaria berberidis CBS 394.84]KAF1849235.1 hypothetical protein K460DRAFT_415639 [Cucurbitaria berberidis CBS 394.84]